MYQILTRIVARNLLAQAIDEQKKYDFKPFDQVLVRASNLGNWNLHLFARVREEEYKYECLGGLRYKECIPYQGNEHLLGTNKNK